jgi:uncharacterized protein
MHLSGLNVYPIKSTRGVPLESGALDDFGLQHDRRWMVVDPGGTFMSQRDMPRLSQVRVGLDGEAITVAGTGAPEIRIQPPDDAAEVLTVRIWGDQCPARFAGAAAEQWFTRFLGVSARLVHMPLSTFRRVNPDYVADRRRVSFADAYPLLLIGEGSLGDLNSRLAAPLPMNRFRPNLVIAGSGAFDEDRWRTIRIGDLVFDVVKPCDRCVTTTVDQATGEKGKEPLTTLAQFRRWNGAVWFGQNLVHRSPGTLRLGDAVTTIAQASNRPPLPAG